jgi:hypothetical protein
VLADAEAHGSAVTAALEARIREVVARRMPRGWRLEEGAKLPLTLEAETVSYKNGDKVIRVRPLVSRWALYCFLHEVGHAVCQHHETETPLPVWREEFEAERWAIEAYRAEGFRVTPEILATAVMNVREEVRSAYERDSETQFDEDVLKWAFSETWREWV